MCSRVDLLALTRKAFQAGVQFERARAHGNAEAELPVGVIPFDRKIRQALRPVDDDSLDGMTEPVRNLTGH